MAVVSLTAGVWRYSYVQALDPVAARGRSDLALAADRLVTQLSRYRETAVVFADHPVLSALHESGSRDEADALLLEVADKISALTLLYADRDGRVLASAHGVEPVDLQDTLYFRRALNGALGVAHGSSTGLTGRAYSFAAPAFGTDATVRGVLVVVVDIERLERDWRGARPTVYFTQANGEVFITNRSEMLGWQQGAAGMTTADGLLPVRRVGIGAHSVWRHGLSPYIPPRALHLVQPLPVIGLRAEALVDVAPALRLAGLQAAAVAGLCLFFGAFLIVATERRRTLSVANAELEERVQARTQALEDANTALRFEVVERQEAEAALKRAQAELVQAGKLSALGQMSAGISHELNQPLMAIQQFAGNGAQLFDRGDAEAARDNLGRISDLAARAARIIKNLRAFVRNENEPMGKVDLVAVIDTAVELTAARLRADAVTLDWQRPEAAVFALGGEVRLSQVFVNLINNAADAMTGQPDKRIKVWLEDGEALRVTVSDTGPGIADPERVFEPFYTTKAVGGGDGMGLGLSISYGLVQSFGGQIRGVNDPGGGARFTVELERWREVQAA